jgi:hypothetical protein
MLRSRTSRREDPVGEVPAPTDASRPSDTQPEEAIMIADSPGLVWAPGGKARVVFGFTVAEDKITAIQMLANPHNRC